jgi:hypothetical protein
MLNLLNRGENILWLASASTATVGVFYLPWIFQLNTPVAGESYVFGFNNYIAILALGTSILFALIASFISDGNKDSSYWFVKSSRLIPTWDDAKTEYTILALWCFVWGFFVFAWGSFLVDPSWCEARIYHYGMDKMAMGRVPYRDFAFAYGPALLYLPYYLSYFSTGLISFEKSYIISLILLYWCGFFSMFVFLRKLTIEVSVRPLVLFLCLVAWSQLTMGLQYTIIRYFVVPFSIIILDVIIRKQIDEKLVSCFTITLTSGVAGLVCFALSPEIGIAGCFGVLAYGVILFIGGSWKRSVSCWSGALSAVLLIYISIPNYLHSILAFASGGSNFPIYPNCFNIALILISLIVLPRMLCVALIKPNQISSPLNMGLAVGGGMMLPGACGRCDPGHVFLYSAIPVMMMFPISARYGRFFRNSWIFIYAVLYVILLQFSYWNLYSGNYLNAIAMHQFYAKNEKLVLLWKSKWDALRLNHPQGKNLHWNSVLPFPDELEEFIPLGPMLHVAGDEGNLWIARYLILQKTFPSDYYDAFSLFGVGAGTALEVQRKVLDTSKAKFLLVPESILALSANSIDLSAYEKSRDAFLSKLFLFPVNSLVRHTPYFPDVEYLKTMLRSYVPIARYQNLIILEKKTADHNK